jgi:methyltransferase (TIGR00027 family)
MREQEPSRTALSAASHRAAHQILEQGRIFADPLAGAILGPDLSAVLQEAKSDPARRGMRLFIAARAHVAESALQAGVEERGIRQLVVLGAGLDTFAYRSPFAHRLRVFEIDHPATQAWKRHRLGDAGIAVPDWLVFAPVDFERGNLLDGLQAAGFDPLQPTFFMWLGVVPYLTEDAVFATLATIANFPGGAEVVFDYGDPPATLAADLQAELGRAAARVAALGEPWLTHFEPAVLHARLKTLGLPDIEDLGPQALAARYWPAAGTGRERGGHVIRAATRTHA